MRLMKRKIDPFGPSPFLSALDPVFRSYGTKIPAVERQGRVAFDGQAAVCMAGGDALFERHRQTRVSEPLRAERSVTVTFPLCPQTHFTLR